MGLFDIFKKKPEETHYDPTNIKVTDLEKGYLFDYNLETWTVQKMAEYDWGNNHLSREFTIESKGKIRYLSIEEDGALEIVLFEKIKYRKLGTFVTNYQKEHQRFPEQITYDNVTYYFDEESPGYYRDVATEDWEELIAFEYINEDEDKYLSIEQWGENSFEASVGIKIKTFEIDSILPVN